MRSDLQAALDGSIWHLLHRAVQAADDAFWKKSREMTPRQLAVLMCVGGESGLSQTEIVEKSGIDRWTVADLVKRMVAKGLLERRRDENDARAYNVRLTRKGESVLRKLAPVAAAVDAEILGWLNKNNRMSLVDMLTQMAKAGNVLVSGR